MTKIDSFIGDEEELKASGYVSEEQKDKDLRKNMRRVLLGIFVVMTLFLAFTIYNYFFNVHPYDKQPLIYLKNNDLFMKNSDKNPSRFTQNASFSAFPDKFIQVNGTSVVSGGNDIIYRSQSKHYLYYNVNGSLYVRANFFAPSLVDQNVKDVVLNNEGNRILYTKQNNDKLQLYFCRHGSKPELICDDLYTGIVNNSNYTKGFASYGFTEDAYNNFFYYVKDNGLLKLYYGADAKTTEVAEGANLGKVIISRNQMVYINDKKLFYKNGSSSPVQVAYDVQGLIFADKKFNYYYRLSDYLFMANGEKSTRISEKMSDFISYNPDSSAIAYYKELQQDKDEIFVKLQNIDNEIPVTDTIVGEMAPQPNLDYGVVSSTQSYYDPKSNMDIQFDDNYNICFYLSDVKWTSLTSVTGTLNAKTLINGSFGDAVKIDDNIVDFKISADGKRVLYVKKSSSSGTDGQSSLYYRDLSSNQSIEVIKNLESVVSVKCGKDLQGVVYLDKDGKLFLADNGLNPRILQENVKSFNINNIGTLDVLAKDNSIYIGEYGKIPSKVDDTVSEVLFY